MGKGGIECGVCGSMECDGSCRVAPRLQAWNVPRREPSPQSRSRRARDNERSPLLKRLAIGTAAIVIVPVALVVAVPFVIINAGYHAATDGYHETTAPETTAVVEDGEAAVNLIEQTLPNLPTDVCGNIAEMAFQPSVKPLRVPAVKVIVTGAGGPMFNTTYYPAKISDGVPSYEGWNWFWTGRMGTFTLRRENRVWWLVDCRGITRYMCDGGTARWWLELDTDIPPPVGWTPVGDDAFFIRHCGAAPKLRIEELPDPPEIAPYWGPSWLSFCVG